MSARSTRRGDAGVRVKLARPKISMAGAGRLTPKGWIDAGLVRAVIYIISQLPTAIHHNEQALYRQTDRVNKRFDLNFHRKHLTYPALKAQIKMSMQCIFDYHIG